MSKSGLIPHGEIWKTLCFNEGEIRTMDFDKLLKQWGCIQVRCMHRMLLNTWSGPTLMLNKCKRRGRGQCTTHGHQLLAILASFGTSSICENMIIVLCFNERRVGLNMHAIYLVLIWSKKTTSIKYHLPLTSDLSCQSSLSGEQS